MKKFQEIDNISQNAERWKPLSKTVNRKTKFYELLESKRKYLNVVYLNRKNVSHICNIFNMYLFLLLHFCVCWGCCCCFWLYTRFRYILLFPSMLIPIWQFQIKLAVDWKFRMYLYLLFFSFSHVYRFPIIRMSRTKPQTFENCTYVTLYVL